MKGIEPWQRHWPATPKRGRAMAGLWRLVFALLALTLLSSCNDADLMATPSTPGANTLTFFAFAEDMPQAVLDAFTREYGITVQYSAFQSPEEAEEHIRAGEHFDVVLVENQLFPGILPSIPATAFRYPPPTEPPVWWCAPTWSATA
jgi:hypothetical protein